jgi:hypothetical protein
MIRSMRPLLEPGVYVSAMLPPGAPPPAAVSPLMTFEEAEGLTLILSRADAERAGIAGTFPCRMITLAVHSSLEAVGFLAEVTARLAQAGIAVNAVSAFHHDHLFVAEGRAAEAFRLLESLAAAKV